MAIDYCHRHDKQFDTDHHVECPACVLDFYRPVTSTMQRVDITEKGAAALIRKLMDGYLFQAHDRELHDECKRALGEA